MVLYQAAISSQRNTTRQAPCACADCFRNMEGCNILCGATSKQTEKRLQIARYIFPSFVNFLVFAFPRLLVQNARVRAGAVRSGNASAKPNERQLRKWHVSPAGRVKREKSLSACGFAFDSRSCYHVGREGRLVLG